MREHRAFPLAGQGQSDRFRNEPSHGLSAEQAGARVLAGGLGGSLVLRVSLWLLERGSLERWSGFPSIRTARVIAFQWWLLWRFKRTGRKPGAAWRRWGSVWHFKGAPARLAALARDRYGVKVSAHTFERAARAAEALPFAYAVRYLRNGPAEHRKGCEVLWIVAQRPTDLVALAAICRRGELARDRRAEAEENAEARRRVRAGYGNGVSAVYRVVGIVKFLRTCREKWPEFRAMTEAGVRDLFAAAVLTAASFEEKRARRSLREREFWGEKRLADLQADIAARGGKPLTKEEARRRREKRKAELEAEARSQSRNGAGDVLVVEADTPAASSSADTPAASSSRGAAGYEVKVSADDMKVLKAGRLPEYWTVVDLALAPVNVWEGWNSAAASLRDMRDLLAGQHPFMIEDIKARVREYRLPEEVPAAVQVALRELGYVARAKRESGPRR